MQGLITNLTPNITTAEGPAPSADSLNSGLNGVSSAQQGFSPLFSNLLTAAAQPGESPFESSVLNSFSAQELPLEGQFLPPGAALGTVNRNNQELKVPLADLPDEMGGEFPVDLKALSMLPNSGGVTVDHTLRSQSLYGQVAENGVVASQLNGRGQSRLQQEMLMRQMALSTSEGGDEELASLRLTPQLETSALQSGGAQLSTMLRDAMLLKQQNSPGNGGGETRVGESFSSALNSLATLATDGKATGEPRSVTQASINTPFAQQASWGEEVGSRVKWMVNSQVQSAELKMNPAHLGPVEVKISVQNDQTSIVFTAQNSAVREALDSAIPRLREMLGDNGMNMVDVDVSDQSFAQQQQASAQDGDDHNGSEGSDSSVHDPQDVASGGEETVMLSSRMVDFYA